MSGELGVLALAILATAGVAGIAPQVVVPPSNRLQTPAHEHQLQWDSGEGVPVSLSIRNDGAYDDRLVRSSTPVARCVSIQRTRLVGGRPQVAPLPDGLLIASGTTITLEPAASHLALFGLQSALVQGATFPLKLYFDRAGEVNVTVRVRRKVDAAGSVPLPPVSLGDLTVTGASARPAPAATPVA